MSRCGSTTATRRTARREEAEARLRELVGADVEVTSQLAARARRRRLAARPAACATRATSRSSRSRPGRRSPSSPRRASTRSTSAPARPATRTAATSGSRSPSSSGRFEALRAVRDAASVRPCTLSPVLVRAGHVPVRPDRAREARGGRARGSRSSTSARATRASRPTRRSGRRSSTALAERMGYPKAEGLPELREAIAGWCERRFGVELDPDAEVIPTYGSKEAIFSFAQVIVDPRGAEGHGRRHRARLPGARARRGVRRRARRGAAAARGERLPPRPRRASRTGTGSRSSGSTTRTTRPARPRRSRFYERARGARARARLPALLRRGVQRALVRRAAASRRSRSPTASNVVVFHTLSKRSSMTGYRSGFVAGAAGGDRRRCARTGRPTGAAPQEFVQRASIVAWNDEEHVERTRERVPAQARGAACRVLEPEGLAGRRERGDDVPLGRGAGRRDARRRAPSGCSRTASSSRRARTSARPARATSASRSCRRSRSASARRRSSRRCL